MPDTDPKTNTPPDAGGAPPPEPPAQDPPKRPTRAERKLAAAPTKPELSAELAQLEAKGSINNRDAKRIHDLRRQIKESN